ncbi:MAG TPA: cell division protein SepF [Thermoplasmata archaeon]|nr:cell division protein SepF [Thermoplasmata archaeon]
MAFIKKPLKRLVEGSSATESDSYIDLGEIAFEEEGAALGEPVRTQIKVAEIYRAEDVNELTTHVYNGNILLIDYSALSNDELALKQVTAMLKDAVRDAGGDVAGVGKNMIMATPGGVKIDRNKIKGTY